VWEGIREDSVLGPCKKCGRKLVIKKARKSGKRFAGCEGYPECDQTYSLPQRGDIIPLGTLCDECGSPEIKVVGRRGRPWITCVDMDCPKQVERREAAAKAKQQEGGEGSSTESAQELQKSTT
jgi:DNA topoisomerase-1